MNLLTVVTVLSISGFGSYIGLGISGVSMFIAFPVGLLAMVATASVIWRIDFGTWNCFG